MSFLRNGYFSEISLRQEDPLTEGSRRHLNTEGLGHLTGGCHGLPTLEGPGHVTMIQLCLTREGLHHLIGEEVRAHLFAENRHRQKDLGHATVRDRLRHRGARALLIARGPAHIPIVPLTLHHSNEGHLAEKATPRPNDPLPLRHHLLWIPLSRPKSPQRRLQRKHWIASMTPPTKGSI